MFKALLVPLDGSPLAEQALPTATRLACALGAELHLVHVHVAASLDPISIEGLPVIDEELHSLAAEHERVYLERVAAQVAGDGLQPIVTRIEGAVVQALTSYARAIQAGLIVMTTHGRSGFAHLWLGSVAEGLVQAAGTPLLLLRPDEHGVIANQLFRRVLVPLDGSPLAEAILPYATALAGLDGGEVVALRVIDTLPVPAALPFHERFRIDAATLAHQRSEAERYLQHVAATLAPAVIQTQVIDADQPARAILATAATLGADLLALTTHGHNATTRATISGITDKVLRGVTRPLLILRPGL